MAPRGGVRVNITGDSSQLDRELRHADRAVGRFADETTKHSSRVSRSFEAMVPSLAAAGAAIGAFGVYSVKQASDVGEALNVTKLMFGDLSDELDYFAQNAAKSMGMSRKEFLQAAGGIGALLKPMGVAEDEAAKMTASLVQRAADIGSAFNASGEEVTQAMKSALAGETEPMRRFGVFLSEARVQAEALALGLGDVSGTTNMAGKAQAIYSLMMKDSNAVAGDFVNTMGESMPNKLKVARAQFDNLTAAIGEKLLPVAVVVLDWMSGKLDELSAWWDSDGKRWMEEWSAGWAEFQTNWSGFWDSFGQGRVQVEDFFGMVSAYMHAIGLGAEDLKRGFSDFASILGTMGQALGALGSDILMTLGYVAQGIGFVVTTLFEGVRMRVADTWSMIQWIAEKIGWMIEQVEKVPSALGGVIDGLGNFGGSLFSGFGFDAGGVVPGPRGAPQLALVHGGETIMPTHKTEQRQQSGGTATINLVVDGKTLASIVSPYLLSDQRARTGYQGVGS